MHGKVAEHSPRTTRGWGLSPAITFVPGSMQLRLMGPGDRQVPGRSLLMAGHLSSSSSNTLPMGQMQENLLLGSIEAIAGARVALHASS